MSEDISLNCFILGGPPNEVYEVKISKKRTVVALRKQIAHELFQGATDSNAVRLFTVSVHKADVETKLGNVLDPANAPGATKLSSRSGLKLGTLFPSPPKENVHIILARPFAGKKSKEKQREHPQSDSNPRVRFREVLHMSDPIGPPSKPAIVTLFHPANCLAFLALSAYDLLSESPLEFGIHHETLATAGRILAYNKPGYLSTSRNRRATPVEAALDSIIPAGDYYYHLDTPGTDPLYPICREFWLWPFPHGRLPSSWINPSPLVEQFFQSNWTDQSFHVKQRDHKCRVSRWKNALTVAHIIPETEEQWLDRNQMRTYLGSSPPYSFYSGNLVSLRYDLHLGNFDKFTFAIVPKSGKLVTHFIRHQDTADYALHFHNTIFDHENTLSHEILYARFALSLIKIAANLGMNPSDVNGDIAGVRNGVGNGNGGRDKRGKKRKRKRRLDDGGAEKKRKRKDGSDDRDRDDDRDARELEEDMKMAARAGFTFFVDPTQPVSQFRYENTVWYPGQAAVERRKEAYLNEHPQIRAHSDRLLPDTYDASDDDDNFE